MTTRSLILSPHEVRAALDGTLGLVVRPVQDLGGTRPENKLGKCPLGVPRTRLVCKETWAELDGGVTWKATEPDSLVEPPGWRSPATMPAWASRIMLEVREVRCVRCADITYEDAEKAGGADTLLGTRGMSPLTVLRDTWTAKYGRRYPWDTSWAWAVGVRRVEG